MRNKKLIIPTLALCLMMAVGGGFVLDRKSTPPSKAIAEVVVTPVEEIKTFYAYGMEFVLPSCDFTVNGTPLSATATLTYPDGTTTSAVSATLNQSGKYILGYLAYDGATPYVKEFTFTVERRAFEYAGQNTQVSYGSYTGYGSNSEGLLVRLENGDSLTFPQLFDMDALTKNTTIVKGFVTPDVQGIADFSTLVFTFTDSENPDITLTVQGNYSGNVKALGLTYFTAAGNGQVQTGEEYAGKLQVNNGLGTPVLHSFLAMDTGAYFGAADPTPGVPDQKQFTVGYDGETRQVWAGGRFVSDLDNADYYSSFWLGFPSGKAKLSISGKNYAALTANFCLTEVLGVDLTATEFKDTEAPVVAVNTDYKEMPLAEVGRQYPVPTATAYDGFDGAREVKVSAWYNYTSSTPTLLDITDGKFKTEKVGQYALVYESKDLAGNIGKEIVWINAVSEIPTLSVGVDGIVTTAKIGEWLALPKANITGGSGAYNVKVTAENGETYEIKEDGFRPEKLGKWSVTYTVTDYIGNTATATAEIEVVQNETPIFVDTPVMPQVLISGTSYVIPTLYANDYTTGKLVRQLCEVEITDKNGTKTYQAGETFKPEAANHLDKVTFVYKYRNQALAPIEVPAAIVFVPSAVGTILSNENYIVGNGIQTQGNYEVDNTLGIKITATENAVSNGFTFANAQNAENFSVVFKTLPGEAGFAGMELVLTDSENPEICIVAKLEKADGKTALRVDGTEVLLNLDFDSKKSQTYEIGYKNNSFVINGSTSLPVAHTASGEAFNGFPSGKLNFNLNFCEVQEGAAYMLYKVNDALLSGIRDTVKPSVAVLGEYGGNYSVNATYEFAPAIGCDIHAPNVSISMTAVAPDGTVVVAKDGTQLKDVEPNVAYFAELKQYGTYTVTYTAQEVDWVTKNSYSFSYVFTVVDEVEPTIKFKGAFQTEAKVGDTLYIPDFTVSDNYSDKDNIQVIKSVYNPNGSVIVFSQDVNAIVCRYEGVYEFHILVTDEAGNCLRYTAQVTVTQ